MPGMVDGGKKSATTMKGVSGHVAFFDKLVDLVPAKFYLESEYETVNKYTHSKHERAQAKQVAKEGHKLKKLAKLDPDQVHTSTSEIKRRAEKAKGGGDGSGDNEDESEGGEDDSEEEGSEEEEGEGAAPKKGKKLPAGGGAALFNGTFNLDGTASRDELKERLQKKIEDYREKRNAEQKHDTAAKAREWKKMASNRTPDKARKGPKGEGEDAAKGKEGDKPKGKRPIDADNADFAFSRVDIPENAHRGAKKAKKLTKEEMLKTAEERVKRGEELLGTEEGRQEKLKHAWGGAIAKASGERVLDNPKLLRKSIKKEQKQKERSRKKWEERKQTQEDQKAKQQKRRKDNLRTRAQGKIKRKIEKREKKLLRPGFEGRKDGMINIKKKDGDNLTSSK